MMRDDRTELELEDRRKGELVTLERWYQELITYLTEGLQDPRVGMDDFSNAATMATRVLIRLKTLYDQQPPAE